MMRLRNTWKLWGPAIFATIASVLMTVFFLNAVHAAPFLTADPYPAGASQPDSVSMKVNGGAAIPCTLKSLSAGVVQPICDLAGLAAGSHQIVMQSEKAPTCTNTTPGSTGTCTTYTPGVSGNFTYTSATVVVPVPTGRALSTQ